MPIKHDGTGKRWVEMELLLPGTPEQIWHALATGPGNTGWFVRAEIEPQVGGKLEFDFGHGATSTGEVTEWQPPLRFAYVEREWAEGAPPCATEITVTARSGDVCVMRMVHSLFTTSEQWDDEIEGFERGWVAFFEILRCYLAHFVGRPAGSFMRMGPALADAQASWQRLLQQTGLENASVGERRSATRGPEPWSGVVEAVHQDREKRYVLLRLDAPQDGILLVGTYDKGATSHAAAAPKTTVSVCRYIYGDDAQARANEADARWEAWMTETFGEADG